MDNGSIRLEGLDEVLRNLEGIKPVVQKAAMKGLQAGAMDIIADAQTNLRTNGSVVTGLLRQSGRTQKVDELTLDVGFFDTTNKGSGYAFYVENGRRAGKMPPPDELIQYCRKKLRMSESEAKKAGWAMALRIARKGTRPHPFFNPAINKNRKKILDRLENEIKKNL